MSDGNNEALEASKSYKSKVEDSMDYIERFDILETINNVGNDEVFTPVRTCQLMLDILPDEVWHNPNYKWLNPCDKNGVFLREIAIRLDKGLKAVPGYEDDEFRRKHIMTEMLYSIGLTKFTALVSRRTNYYCSSANRKPDGDIDKDGHYKNGFAVGYGEWFDTEEGNILTPITEHHFVKGKCEFCYTSESGRYTDPDQNEHYAYEFIHVPRLNLQKHMQKRFSKGDKDMRFDIVIGNPPYQLANGEGSHTNSSAIYHLFVKQAKTLKPKYLCMIIPSKWMAGGMGTGLNEFRKEMIEDDSIEKVFDYSNGKQVFPNNDIKGGVLYFLRTEGYHGLCEYHSIDDDGNESISNRSLKTDSSSNTIIRKTEMLHALNQVRERTTSDSYFIKLVSSVGPYGFFKPLMDNDLKSGKNDIFKDKPIEDGLQVLGLGPGGPGNRVHKWISKKSDFVRRNNNLDRYKVFVSEAYKSGSFGEQMSKLEIGKPYDICTETFLEVGPFDTEREAENCIKYMKTKFFRSLVSLIKTTQHATSKVYSYVPLQDFKSNNDIDWNGSIDDIDEHLFEKYDLNGDDIAFIKENVEAMD